MYETLHGKHGKHRIRVVLKLCNFYLFKCCRINNCRAVKLNLKIKKTISNTRSIPHNQHKNMRMPKNLGKFQFKTDQQPNAKPLIFCVWTVDSFT